MTDEKLPICERLRHLADFAEAANGNHARSVHPNTVADGFRKAADTIEALVEEIERWKSKLLVVATERDRLAEHREKLIEEIAELRASLGSSAQDRLSRARNEQVTK